MEEGLKIANVDAKRITPMDLVVYKKNRELLTKIIILQKKWKEADGPLNLFYVKTSMIKLINENFEAVEKTCAFLGAYSTPYTLGRIRKQLEETLIDILEKYHIPYPLKTLKEKSFEIEKLNFFYLADDLDVWLAVKK